MSSTREARQLAEKALARGFLGSKDLLRNIVGGRYRVEGTLGQGAAGLVLRVTDTVLQRPAALKLLNETRGAERFLREVRLLARLRHEHIVEIFDAGLHEGRPYYVMDFCEGGTLAEADLSLEEWISVLIKVCRACQAAHEAGVVHRDLKPENVLLGQRPLVADFGVAKLLEAEDQPGRTRTGAWVGTPSYMAPEQLSGRGIGPWTDIHALGVMLFERLTGRLPFEAENPVALAAALAREERPDPREFNPKAPFALCAVARRALSFRPEDRYASAEEMAQALERALASSPWTSRRLLLALGLGAASALLLLLLLPAALGDDPEPALSSSLLPPAASPTVSPRPSSRPPDRSPEPTAKPVAPARPDPAPARSSAPARALQASRPSVQRRSPPPAAARSPTPTPPRKEPAQPEGEPAKLDAATLTAIREQLAGAGRDQALSRFDALVRRSLRDSLDDERLRTAADSSLGPPLQRLREEIAALPAGPARDLAYAEALVAYARFVFASRSFQREVAQALADAQRSAGQRAESHLVAASWWLFMVRLARRFGGAHLSSHVRACEAALARARAAGADDSQLDPLQRLLERYR